MIVQRFVTVDTTRYAAHYPATLALTLPIIRVRWRWRWLHWRLSVDAGALGRPDQTHKRRTDLAEYRAE